MKMTHPTTRDTEIKIVPTNSDVAARSGFVAGINAPRVSRFNRNHCSHEECESQYARNENATSFPSAEACILRSPDGPALSVRLTRGASKIFWPRHIKMKRRRNGGAVNSSMIFAERETALANFRYLPSVLTRAASREIFRAAVLRCRTLFPAPA
jgi:hypothetical protein